MLRTGRLMPGAAAVGMLLTGCQSWFVADADHEVRRLIEQRQRAALGETHSADVGGEDGRIGSSEDMYSFVPHPVDPDVPEAFRKPVVTSQPSSQPVPDSQPAPERKVYTLPDAVAYAMGHAREFQFAKEDLYLSALDLTLERHLWTPQFVAEVSAGLSQSPSTKTIGQGDNARTIPDFDRAMTAVAQAGVTQRLPMGGEVTAQMINTLVRDLHSHATTGETGQMILSADLPLLRGAGRVALESRYQAERDLIYAVRNFEQFRREYLVTIATDYFNLLSIKSEIENARASEQALRDDAQRSQALADKGQALQVEADRAQVEYLIAKNDAINAEASYDTALDRFKITLGMPTDTPIDVVEPELELVAPQIPEAEAIEVAMQYRLDLLNQLDRVDDARRQVLVARNNLLPAFNLRGSMSADSDPDRKNSMIYSNENATWRGEAVMEIPVDRKAERNDYRSSLIALRRAERQHELGRDQVRLDVRNALRQLEQARVSMEIQQRNIDINAFRKEQARDLFSVGRLSSNRDVVEAENAYRTAKNNFASAQSDYRTAVLEFLRDTGTLRVDDEGKLVRFESPATVSEGSRP